MRRLIYILLLVCLPVISQAKEPTATKAPQKPQGKVNQVSMDQPMFRDVMALWQRCIHDYESQKYSDLLVDLNSLRGIQTGTGVRNLKPISSTLIRMALTLAERDQSLSTLALDLTHQAQSISPDFPPAYVAASKLATSGDNFTIGEMFKSFTDGVRAQWRHFPSMLKSIGKHTVIFLVLLFLVLLIITLSLLRRYLPLFSHDLGHLLPPGTTAHQKLLAASLILIVPFILDLGLIAVICTCWLALWAYTNKSEKVVIVMGLAALMLLPIANTLLSASLTSPRSIEHTLARCNSEVCSVEDQSRLEAALDPSRPNGRLLYSMALTAYRQGAFEPIEMERAMAYLVKLGKVSDRRMQVNQAILQGNIYFSKGVHRCSRRGGSLISAAEEFQEANKAYGRALSLDPDHPDAMYNRGRLLYFQAKAGEGDILITRAREAGGKRVMDKEEISQFSGQTDHLCQAHFNHNRELLTPPLGVRDLFISTFHKAGTDRLLALHTIMLGPLEPRQLPFLSLGVFLLMGLLLLVTRRFRPSQICIRCGEVSCTRCRAELTGTGICEACLFFRIRGSFVDPKEVWLRQKRIESRFRRRKQWERALTFLFPGFGHYLRGMPFRGGIYLCVFFYPLLGILVNEPLLDSVPGLTRELGNPLMQVAAFSLISIVAYLLALLDIYSRD